MPQRCGSITRRETTIELLTGKDAGDQKVSRNATSPRGARRLLHEFVTARDHEPVDELGIPVRSLYLALALFAFLVSCIPLIFAFTPDGRELRHPAVIGVLVVGIAIAPTLVMLGRRWRHEFHEWAFQAVLLYAVAGPFICHLVLSDLRPSILTLYMLGPIGAAYFMPLMRALPMIVIGDAAIVYVSTAIDEPDAVLRGITVAVVATAGALMLSAMKNHLAKTLRANHDLAERDALTGVFNLRKFDERLAAEIARSSREKSGFALVGFDLDHFKQVNDFHSHTVGDAVLVAAAAAIGEALSPADLLVRRGGDEFMVIAPIAPDRNLTAMVEDARERVARARGKICPDVAPSISAGWVIHSHDESAESVLRRADDALHDAKTLAREKIAATAVPRDSGAVPLHTTSATARVVELRARPATGETAEQDPIAGAMRIAWRTAGLSTLMLSVVLACVGFAGKTSFEFTPVVWTLLAAWAFAMAPFALWISTRRRQSVAMAHMLSASSLVLISLTCTTIGDAAPVAVEMLLLANITFMALLPARQAALYAIAGFGLYGYFLYSSSYPTADIRLATTVVNFGAVGTLLAINRHRTLLASKEKARLACTDPLTGLPNMRLLRERLTYEIRRCESTDCGLAILMLDLDEFKSVNDEYSHSAGDEVLVTVADALRNVSRHADMPARRGGDEFVVVLTDADEYDAAAAAERVSDAIRAARLRVMGDVNPNASVGWAVWRRGDGVDELIHRADRALKRVKSAGRRDRRAAREPA